MLSGRQHIRFGGEDEDEEVEVKVDQVENVTSINDNLKPVLPTSVKNLQPSNNKKDKIKTTFTKPIQTKPSGSEVNEDGLLLKEITMLGGTKEDFDLLKDIESDEEFVENSSFTIENKSQNLEADLNKFIKQLGINKIVVEDLEDSSLEQENQTERLEENLDVPFETQPEVLEQEVPFNPADSIVASGGLSRTFVSNSGLKPNSSLFDPLVVPLFENTPIWYELPLPQLKDGKAFSSEYASSLRNQAKALWEQECELVSKKTFRSSDKGLMEQILRSGTLSDKISALTLKIQEAPLHHFTELNKLLSMMKRNNRREALPCLNSFKDLCVGSLLPSDRKLVFFEDQPLSSPDVTQNHLVLWYFEDYLKKGFFDFLLVAEARSHDPVGTAKHNVLTHFYELLTSKPEQGANLLTLLANKLGDKENKIASRASHLLLRAIEMNPELKADVVTEIDAIVSRPNISIRAQYYSSLTLNQFVLNISEVSIANQLIEMYFRLFKKFLNVGKPAEKTHEKKQKARHRDTKNTVTKPSVEPPTITTEEEISRTITAILSGVNRAFPYVDIDAKVLEEHISTLFHISRTFNFNAAIQALTLLMQIADSQPQIRPRLRKALYLSLLDARIIHSSKQAMHLNLLHRFLKDETDLSSLMAFVKRMCQIACWHQPPYVNGLLYIISKLSTVNPVVKSSINQPEDVLPPDDVLPLESNNPTTNELTASAAGSEAGLETAASKTYGNPHGNPHGKVINSLSYKGRDDAPSKSLAEYTCLWELEFLLRHFHPTVAHFSRQILTLNPIKDQPELQNHTLIHFLDRFAYRNAKKTDESLATSTQHLFAPNSSSGGLKWTKNGVFQTDVMDEDFILKSEEQIAADQIFFHKYFNLQSDPFKKKKSKSNHDVGSDGEEEFFASLFGGPDDKGSDLDDDMLDDDRLDDDMLDDDRLDDDMLDDDRLDDDMLDNDMLDDDRLDDINPDAEENNLVHTELAPGFDDFDGSDQLDSDLQSSNANSDVPLSDDQDTDSAEDIDFEMNSDNENLFSNSKKGSSKRKVQAVSSNDELTSEKFPIDNKKRNQTTKERKKKLRALPTFASLDDYSAMLSD